MVEEDIRKTRTSRLLFMPYLTTILIILLMAVPAKSVEVFRYRGTAKDGGTLEYAFEAGEQILRCRNQRESG